MRYIVWNTFRRALALQEPVFTLSSDIGHYLAEQVAA